MFHTLNKKDKLYYARIVPNCNIYDLCELIVRTVTDRYFVGVDKQDKRAYLFTYEDLGTLVFEERNDALKKVTKAEENKKEISNEIYYEEY